MTAARITLAVTFLICWSMNASDYCSLIVKISDPKGNPVLVPVAVEDQGNTSQRQDSRGGTAMFCGLGITPVNIVVGRPECNQIVIRNVPLHWGRTTIVPVTYDREPCIFDAPPSGACVFLFRFYDLQGQVVPRVLLNLRSPRRQTFKSDGYGRVFLSIPAGQQLSASASAAQGVPVELEIPCTSETQRVERRVTLDMVPKK